MVKWTVVQSMLLNPLHLVQGHPDQAQVLDHQRLQPRGHKKDSLMEKPYRYFQKVRTVEPKQNSRVETFNGDIVMSEHQIIAKIKFDVKLIEWKNF